MRREQQGTIWLKARGVPAGGAVALLWIIKLAAVGILLYTAFWLALLLVLALLGAWMIRNDDGSYDEEHKPAPIDACQT